MRNDNRRFFPDAFIVGLPRAGTSSLAYWLSDHPSTAVSNPKETFYLMDASRAFGSRHRYCRDGGDRYHKYFRLNGDLKTTRFVDATTHYYYQETALKQITAREKPLAIMILRDPIKRLTSMFTYFKYVRLSIPRSVELNDYARCLINRSMDIAIPDKGTKNALLGDLYNSKFSYWIERWSEAISDRFMVTRASDLFNEPAPFVKAICERMDIDARFFDEYDYEVYNESYIPRFRMAHRIKSMLSNRRMRAFLPGSLRQRYKNIQKTTGFPTEVLEESVRVDLERYYREEIDIINESKLGAVRGF